jgi:hypothetical protein
VKHRLAWLAGIVGIAALGRMLARRRHSADGAQLSADVADPAEELRRKLAEQRQPTSDVEPQPRVEPEPEVEPEPADETLEGRRARVHAKGRAAIDTMGDDGPAA